MTTFTVAAIVLFSLCAPLFADSAAPPPSTVKVRFALREPDLTRSFDVIVAPDRPCATASDRKPDRQVELKACIVRDSLDIEWMSRKSVTTSTGSSSSEYRSTSSVKIVRGETTELGSSEGPRLSVTILQ
jgi:hypothetical protein